MSRPCFIVLAGLSATEKVLIEGTLFRPSGSPIPGATLAHDLSRANLIIANADDAATVASLRALPPASRVLLLGASDAGTGWPVLPRPLRIHAMLEAARRALMLPRRGAALRVAAEPPAADTGFEATQPADAVPPLADDFEPAPRFSDSLPSVVPSGWDAEVAEWEQEQIDRLAGPGRTPGVAAAEPLAPGPTPVRPPEADAPPLLLEQALARAGAADPVPGDRILIIGQPGAAADGLIKTLQSAGFDADFAAGGEAAFALLAQRPYGFVFLIEVSLGPAAIALCRDIRKRFAAAADLRLVIVASHSGRLARVRAHLAGCNAWMTIPLDRAALVESLRRKPSGLPAPG